MDQLGSELRPNPEINIDAALDLINSEDDSAGQLDQEEEEKEEVKETGPARTQHQRNEKLLELIRQAEPIAEKSAYNPQSLEEAAWRRKKVRQMQLNMTMDDGEEEPDNDDEWRRNQENQERLQGYGAQIPVTTNCNVRFDLNPGPDGKGAFKYLIYDGYKPRNLLHSREYLEFLLSDTISDATEAPRDVVRYMQQDILTKLPQRIRESDVLEFDQNFECGNLDQVYLKSDFEYDLLIKVDTNTRGNTYWFYFKVSGFMIGLQYKFNIMNFTRNLSYFFGNGMNICSRTESEEMGNSDWQYNKCFNINFQGAGSIVRGQRKVNVVDSDGEEKTETQKRYFGQLTFCHIFTEEQRGQTVSFAAAVPYGYSDMLKDLRDARHFLMQDENSNFRYDEGKSQLIKKFIPKVNFDGTTQNNQTQGQGEQLLANISVKAEGPGSDTTALKNVIEMERENIRREGQLQLQNAQNRFEQQMRARQLALKLHLPRSNNFTINSGNLLYKQEVIGQSLCGLNIYQIVITKRPEFSMRMKRKQVIYIEARLHAAETHGSLILKAMLFDIIKNPQKYDKLLHTSILKFVPMLNPDGVVIGNARCSFAGLDLNRRWSDPSYSMHPEIFFLKMAMAMTLRKQKRISIFCDLHGHNKHMNTFVYGCNKAPNEGLLSWTKTRLLPKIIASYEPIFHFQMCQFSQEKTKYNTARVVVWNEFRVLNSFTLETSMYGKEVPKTYVVRDDKGYEIQRQRMVVEQLTLEDMYSIGVSLLKSFDKYIVLEVELEKEYMMTNGWLKKQRMNQLAGYSARDKADIMREEKIKKERAEKKKVMMLKRTQVIMNQQVPGMNQRVKGGEELSSGAEDAEDAVKAQASNANAKEFAKYKEQTGNQLSINTSNKNVSNAGPQLEPGSPTKTNKRIEQMENLVITDERPKPPIIIGQASDEPVSPTKKKEGNVKSTPQRQGEKPPAKDSQSAAKAKKSTNNTTNQAADTNQIKNKIADGLKNLMVEKTATMKKKKNVKNKKVEMSKQRKHEESEKEEPMGWSAFFDDNELAVAVEESKEPVKPHKPTTKDYEESDSEPSCDNFGEEDLVKRFEVAMDNVEKEKQVARAEEHKLAKMPKLPKPKPEPPKKPVKMAPKPKYKLYQRFDILRAQINARIQLDAAKKSQSPKKQSQPLKQVDQELGPPSRLQMPIKEPIEVEKYSTLSPSMQPPQNENPVDIARKVTTEPTPNPKMANDQDYQTNQDIPSAGVFSGLRKEVDRRRLRPMPQAEQTPIMQQRNVEAQGVMLPHFLQQSQSDTVNHDEWQNQSREQLPGSSGPPMQQDGMTRNHGVASSNGHVSPLMASKESGSKVTPLKLVQQSLSRDRLNLKLNAGTMSVTNSIGSIEQPKFQQEIILPPAKKPIAPAGSVENSPEQPFESNASTNIKQPLRDYAETQQRIKLAGHNHSVSMQVTDRRKEESDKKKMLMAMQGSYELNEVDRQLLGTKTEAIRHQANMSEAYLGQNPMMGGMSSRKQSLPGAGKTTSLPASKMKRQNRYFSPNNQQNIETQFEDLTLPEIPQRREPPIKHQSHKAASMAERNLVSPERSHPNVRSRQQTLHKYSKSNVTLSTRSRGPHGI